MSFAKYHRNDAQMTIVPAMVFASTRVLLLNVLAARVGWLRHVRIVIFRTVMFY